MPLCLMLAVCVTSHPRRTDPANPGDKIVFREKVVSRHEDSLPKTAGRDGVPRTKESTLEREIDLSSRKVRKLPNGQVSIDSRSHSREITQHRTRIVSNQSKPSPDDGYSNEVHRIHNHQRLSTQQQGSPRRGDSGRKIHPKYGFRVLGSAERSR